MSIYYEADDKIVGLIKSRIDLSEKALLDIGCGDGHLTRSFADAAKTVLGLDPDRESIVEARKNITAENSGNLAFINQSIEEFNPSETAIPFDHALYLWSL